MLLFEEHPFHCYFFFFSPFSSAHIPRDPFIHQQTPGVEQGQEHRNTGTWCVIFRSARYLQALTQLIETTSPVHLERRGQWRAAAQRIPGKTFAWWNFFHILVWQIKRNVSLKLWLWHTSSLAVVWEVPEDLTQAAVWKYIFLLYKFRKYKLKIIYLTQYCCSWAVQTLVSRALQMQTGLLGTSKISSP